MANLKLTRRPNLVLPEHRPIYKMAQAICIIGYTGRGGKASTLKINLVNWALESKPRQDTLVISCSKNVLPFAAWGFDPALALALLLCNAERLTEATSSGYQLTKKGNSFFISLVDDPEILVTEKTFLMRLGKRLTEKLVEQESKRWGDYEDKSV